MTRLLVTGAGGLLGRALLAKLPLNRYEVFAAVTDKSKAQSVYGVTAVGVNLLCEESRRELIKKLRPEAAVHLAWNQAEGFRNSETNMEWLAASLDLLRCFHEYGGVRFIFAGSSSEYDAENGRFCENEGAAKTQYGVCKRIFNEAALVFGNQFGIKTASARYFTIYGEHDRHHFGAIPSAINAFLRKESVICKAPETIRDYIYAGDAAAATLKLLESDLIGPVNIASGEPRTMKDVFTAIAAEIGAGNLLRFADPQVSPDILEADTYRMHNELGYTCETSFDEGLKKTIDWWRSALEV